jgi:hypothetical protein
MRKIAISIDNFNKSLRRPKPRISFETWLDLIIEHGGYYPLDAEEARYREARSYLRAAALRQTWSVVR